ncbi:MAG TPA: DUF1493 family protein [Pyrinomonadaceae bacterium]|nr:DUF1493 family protein [Pyrinomonadaceae bacterium]
MSTNRDLLEEVKTFVAEFWGEPIDRLTAETSVNEDLGMDGDDGVEFMQTFGERFAVDLDAFPHDKYFGPEAGATPLSILVCVVRRVTTGRWNGLTRLTLRELTDAAGRRRWADARVKIAQRQQG